ncbi:DUF1294 domain-containing protein [Caenimonas sedimenti]|uniref:DUF1294 domain-containing protein n=1 Tax=Caenimonas sedimenti TaxID=2596921 RepID=UPI0021072BAB|nr:cold shock and DUF1294 domain-containing protein [Caenimonas sedimenti]
MVRWDEVRAFGFIRSAGTSADIFFHIRDFRGRAGGAPREGMAVSFEEIHVGGKGPRAMAVQPSGPVGQADGAGRVSARSRTPSRSRKSGDTGATVGSGALFALPLMLAYAGLLAWAVAWTRQLPWWVLAGSVAVNLVTFMVYWFDKYAAGTRQWRTSEATLHLWSLAGGWAGAWCAQQVLRHKSRKAEFRTAYWATVILHCVAVAGALAWKQGLLPL